MTPIPFGMTVSASRFDHDPPEGLIVYDPRTIYEWDGGHVLQFDGSGWGDVYGNVCQRPDRRVIVVHDPRPRVIHTDQTAHLPTRVGAVLHFPDHPAQSTDHTWTKTGIGWVNTVDGSVVDPTELVGRGWGDAEVLYEGIGS